MAITAIIITKNEETMLPDCLKSLNWVDELIIVDSDSQDKTTEIAKKYNSKIISTPDSTDYATARNLGLKHAARSWIFYIDADERVTSSLKKEIQDATSTSSPQPISYKIPRQNIMLGRWLKHGGFWPDHVHRLFNSHALVKWTGKLHESPTVIGKTKSLSNSLQHFTARTISSALQKSALWAPIEAQLLFKAKSPKVSSLKIIKAFFQKLFQNLIVKKGFLDGARGIILAYIQASHHASTLVSLWQIQNSSHEKTS